MTVFTKISQLMVFALSLTGCAHTVDRKAPVKEITVVKQALKPTHWHDGSKGGKYGIGDGWSIEILPAEYETIFEVGTLGHPRESRLISIPAEYMWIKDESVDTNKDPIMVSQLVTLPAQYMTVTEDIVVKPASKEYYFTDVKYNTDGSVNTPKTVKLRTNPAVIKQKNRRVVKVPARTVERMLPLDIEKRNGYRRVVKTPARNVERPWFVGPYYLPKVVESQPWRFLIRKPNDGIVHVFDNFEHLTAFIDSLN